jgi:hypothetical protein
MKTKRGFVAVCKQWCHVGTPILYEEVVFRRMTQLHQEKSKCTLCHLVTLVDLIKLNKVDSEGDLLNLSQNVLKIAYLRPQGALSLVKYVVKAPNREKFA